MTLRQLFNRWIEPLRTRVLMMVGRAVIKAVNDSKDMQLVQIELLKDELKDDVERVQNYGFTSHPEAGAEAVAVFIGGNRDVGMVIAVDDSRYRLKLSKGEVAMYSKFGNEVRLTKDGEVLVVGDAVLLGSEGGIVRKLVDERLLDIYNNHTHAAAGGTTGTPLPTIGDLPPALPALTSVTKAE